MDGAVAANPAESARMYREENFHPPTSRRTELTHLRVGRYAGRVGSEPHQIGDLSSED